MLLGMCPMNRFEFLRILEKKKSQKGKIRKSSKHGPLCRGVALCHSEGCLSMTRPKGKKGPPRLRYDVALLRRGVGTVHREKFFGFCF